MFICIMLIILCSFVSCPSFYVHLYLVHSIYLEINLNIISLNLYLSSCFFKSGYLFFIYLVIFIPTVQIFPKSINNKLRLFLRTLLVMKTILHILIRNSFSIENHVVGYYHVVVCENMYFIIFIPVFEIHYT